MAVARGTVSVEPLRVLLADDHTAFRGGVRALIDSTSGMEVAGEAATGTEAVEQAMSLQPDVILMDIHMPRLNGILATRKIVTRSPHIGVVIFTVNPVGDVLFAGLHAGARGFLLKDSAPQDIVRAIQAVGGRGGDLRARIREPARRLLHRVERGPSGADRALAESRLSTPRGYSLMARPTQRTAGARCRLLAAHGFNGVVTTGSVPRPLAPAPRQGSDSRGS